MNESGIDDHVDRDLIAKVREGDRAALDELFRRNVDPAYRAARRLTGSQADAEDVVQNAFMQIMALSGSYRQEASVRSWITAVVVNSAKMHMRSEQRRRRRQEIAAEQKESSSEGNGADDERELVRQAIDSLPERYRMPVWLRFVEELTFKDIAATLGANQKTVEAQVARGLELVRKTLIKRGLPLATPAIIAALLPKSTEAAPAHLADACSQLAAKASPVSAASMAGSKVAVALWAKIAAAAVVVACGIVAATWHLLSHGASSVLFESPELTMALNSSIDLHLVRDRLPEMLDAVNRAVRLKTGTDLRFAIPETLKEYPSPGFSFDAQSISARAALERIAKANGLSWRPAGDFVVWSRPLTAYQRRRLESLRQSSRPSDRLEAAAEASFGADLEEYHRALLAVADADTELASWSLRGLDFKYFFDDYHWQIPLARTFVDDETVRAIVVGAAALARSDEDKAILASLAGALRIGSLRRPLLGWMGDVTAPASLRKAAAWALIEIGEPADLDTMAETMRSILQPALRWAFIGQLIRRNHPLGIAESLAPGGLRVAPGDFAADPNFLRARAPETGPELAQESFESFPEKAATAALVARQRGNAEMMPQLERRLAQCQEAEADPIMRLTAQLVLCDLVLQPEADAAKAEDRQSALFDELLRNGISSHNLVPLARALRRLDHPRMREQIRQRMQVVSLPQRRCADLLIMIAGRSDDAVLPSSATLLATKGKEREELLFALMRTRLPLEDLIRNVLAAQDPELIEQVVTTTMIHHDPAIYRLLTRELATPGANQTAIASGLRGMMREGMLMPEAVELQEALSRVASQAGNRDARIAAIAGLASKNLPLAEEAVAAACADPDGEIAGAALANLIVTGRLPMSELLSAHPIDAAARKDMLLHLPDDTSERVYERVLDLFLVETDAQMLASEAEVLKRRLGLNAERILHATPALWEANGYLESMRATLRALEQKQPK